jgi:hypothetical protein
MKNYEELIREKERHEWVREAFEHSLKHWEKLYNSSCPKELTAQNYQMLVMPRGSRNDTTLDALVYNINHCKNIIHTETEAIKELQTILGIVGKGLKDSKNVYHNVSYLKNVKDEYGQKRFTIEDIADMLGYSEPHIKRISKSV